MSSDESSGAFRHASVADARTVGGASTAPRVELDATSEGKLVWPDRQPPSELTTLVLIIVGERDFSMNAITESIAPEARTRGDRDASHHPGLQQRDESTGCCPGSSRRSARLLTPGAR